MQSYNSFAEIATDAPAISAKLRIRIPLLRHIKASCSAYHVHPKRFLRDAVAEHSGIFRALTHSVRLHGHYGTGIVERVLGIHVSTVQRGHYGGATALETKDVKAYVLWLVRRVDHLDHHLTLPPVHHGTGEEPVLPLLSHYRLSAHGKGQHEIGRAHV